MEEVEDLDDLEVYHWELMEFVFAERYQWQNIDDMPLLERRRKFEIIQGYEVAKKIKKNNAPSG